MNQPGTFPVLSDQEILSFLSNITESSTPPQVLRDPVDAKFFREIYEIILSLLLNLGKDEWQEAIPEALESLPYPQLHSKSISELNFWRQLYKISSVFILTNI